MFRNETSRIESHRVWIATLCLCGLMLATGCENAGQGAVSGGAVGALSGLAIGSLSGNAGAGAAIGAVTGAVGGAVIGDQNRRNKEAQEAYAQNSQAYAQNSQPRVYVTGGPLWNLVGNWNVTGDELTMDGQHQAINGTVKGIVDKTYFLRLDCTFNNPNGGDNVEGTSVISQDGGDKLTMTNSFSSSPQMVRYDGKVDKSGLLFKFKQTDPKSNQPRTMKMRLVSQNQWSVEVWQKRSGKDQVVETYTFTRAT